MQRFHVGEDARANKIYTLFKGTLCRGKNNNWADESETKYPQKNNPQANDEWHEESHVLRKTEKRKKVSSQFQTIRQGYAFKLVCRLNCKWAKLGMTSTNWNAFWDTFLMYSNSIHPSSLESFYHSHPHHYPYHY